MRAQVSAVILWLALSLTGVAAQAGDLEAGQQLVHNFLNEVGTLSANFEQRLINANGEVLEQSSGTLEISRPGRFRWVYDEPYEQWLVADGTNVWSYDVDLAQVTVKAQSLALANTPALLLGGTVDVLEQFSFGGSFDDGSLTWVRLTPKNTDAGFKQVELAFHDDKLERMVFYDNLAQVTTIILSKLVVNDTVRSTDFEFSIPDGVDVVGTPATAAQP